MSLCDLRTPWAPGVEQSSTTLQVLTYVVSHTYIDLTYAEHINWGHSEFCPYQDIAPIYPMLYVTFYS